MGPDRYQGKMEGRETRERVRKADPDMTRIAEATIQVHPTLSLGQVFSHITSHNSHTSLLGWHYPFHVIDVETEPGKAK